MKLFNASLLASLIAVPAIAMADGGATDHVVPADHTQANASEVRAAVIAARANLANNDATGGLISFTYTEPKTRAQVRAELAEARRLGLTQSGEQTVVPTLEQQVAITLAGLRALEGTPVAGNANTAAVIASPDVAQ
jgi:hypothetical protein